MNVSFIYFFLYLLIGFIQGCLGLYYYRHHICSLTRFLDRMMVSIVFCLEILFWPISLIFMLWLLINKKII